MQPSPIPSSTVPTQTPSFSDGQAALLRITQAIATAVNLDELLLLALGELTQLFQLPHGSVMLIEEDGTTAQVAGQYPPRVAATPSITLERDPLLARITREHQPIVIVDVEQATLEDEVRQRLVEQGRRAALFFPLIAQDRLLGVLRLDSEQPRQELSADELVLAQVLAGQLALAISTARLYEAARRRAAELDTINDIAATVTSSLDPREVYKLVVEKLNEYFRVEAGSILLLDDATGELVFVMTIEAGEEKLFGWRVPKGQGVVGAVAESQQHVILHDAQSDPRFYKKVSEDVGFVTRSILCVPMLVQNRTIGVIELLNKLNGDFTAEDAERLSAMANTIAVAIENASLFQEVARGRDRLEALLNSTEDGILMIDTGDQVVTANPMLERFFGLNWRELLNKQGTEIIAQLEQQTRPIAMQRASDPDSDTNAVVADYEVLEPRRSFVRQVKLPVQSKEGSLLGELVVFHDITEERQLEQLREDYTHMLVHDLRSPLTGILNGLAMVRRGLVGTINDAQAQSLDIAYNSGQAMLRMVNTLLDISKMEAGQMTLDRQPASLYEVVDSALERVVPLAASSSITLENGLPSGLPLVDIDREKIIRVLQNLLDNAIKFTPDGGTVRIAGVVDQPEHPGAVVLSVHDTGPGIPEQYRQRIFEKFGQIKDRKVKGTGLGLTFCKLTVEAHAGEIWVESEEGKGSTFLFTLPLTA